MADFTYTPLDDIVTEIATLSPGDTATLTGGQYSIAGNILHEDVEIICRDGVVINSTGDLLVNTVSVAKFTGKAILESGTINIVSTTLVLSATSINSRIDVEGYVTVSIEDLNGSLFYDPVIADTNGFFYIGRFSGSEFTTTSIASKLFITISKLTSSSKTTLSLKNATGTIQIDDSSAGNELRVTESSSIEATINGMPPAAYRDATSTLILKGDVRNTLTILSDVTLEDFQAVATDLCLTSTSAVIVSVGKNVSLNSLLGKKSDTITLTGFDYSTGGITDHTLLTNIGTNTHAQIDTHIADTDIHLSTDERAAFDNTPNPATGTNPLATQADLGAAGFGDMLKSQYDQDNDGIVDNSEKLGNQLPAYYATDADLDSHTGDTLNPHTVTAAQVGLGAVDNTSDLNKPISTATQTALNLKKDDFSENSAFNKNFGTGATNVAPGTHLHTGVYEPADSAIQAHLIDSTNPHSVTATQVGLGSVDNTTDLLKPISTATQAVLDTLDDTSNSPFIVKTATFTPALGENYIIDGTLLMTMDSGVADGSYWDIFISSGTLTIDWDDPDPIPFPTLVIGHHYRIIRSGSGTSVWEMFDFTASGSGTVTSVTSGDGMDFTDITTTGPVVLGTPTTDLTPATTNAVSTTSHTHKITGFEKAHEYGNKTASTSPTVNMSGTDLSFISGKAVCVKMQINAIYHATSAWPTEARCKFTFNSSIREVILTHVGMITNGQGSYTGTVTFYPKGVAVTSLIAYIYQATTTTSVTCASLDLEIEVTIS